MQLLNPKARIALKVALTAVKAYGATQRARGRAAARKTTGGIRRGAAAGVALGGAAVYLLDPQQGKRRRNVARDKAFAWTRRGARTAARKTDYAAGVAKGAAHAATPSGSNAARLDDTTLTRKVESEIFRDADVPKGRISVNTENGVVYLRGEIERTEQIEALGQAAADVDGVEKVENLLHPPGTPAPMKR